MWTFLLGIAVSDIARVDLNVKLETQSYSENLKNKNSIEYRLLKTKVVDAVSFAFSKKYSIYVKNKCFISTYMMVIILSMLFYTKINAVKRITKNHITC